jgi:hypothetical protein
MPHALPVLCSSLVLGLALAMPAAAEDWKPIDPSHLALREALIQKGADAEALIWEVSVADNLTYNGDLTTTFEHYLRVKIFTDRGRERFATVDIPYASGMDVADVAARTIRPDGSIVELKKSDVYRRTVIKANDLKVTVVSFAVPAIESGAIVEYRWREVYRDSLAMNLRLKFSRDIPVHTVRYFVRPLAIPGMAMTARPFNGDFTPPVKQKNGASMLSLANVPADSSEAYSLPPYEQRPWVFISYEASGRRKTETFGREFGASLYDDYRKASRPNDELRALARQAVAGAGSDRDKVTALVRAARAAVRRVDVDTVTPDERKKVRANRTAGEALKRGTGTYHDVLLVFLALAESAALDARVAATPNRGDLLQRSVQPHPYFINGRIAAVRSGDGWIFVDPGNEYAANGELPWQYEAQKVLIGDPTSALYATTPLSPPAYSVKRRSATLRLTPDGTLEGTARVEYTGHWAELFREQEDQDAPSEREQSLRAMMESRLPGAEISGIAVENVTEPGVYANVFRVRMPDFAQRTGARLFLQPAIFQRGAAALFQNVDRTSEVYFEFPWLEQDEVRIDLPAGYVLETPEGLPPVTTGSVTYEVSVTQDGGQLVFRRAHAVGHGGGILFPPAAYRAIRAVFDVVHRGDSQTIVLRRAEGGQ